MTWSWYEPSRWRLRRELRPRQTHLGMNAEDQLVIVDLKLDRPPAYVLQLPNEILHNIFSFLREFEPEPADWTPCGTNRDFRRDMTAVLLSCRRFNRVAERLMYRSLDVFLVPSNYHEKHSLQFYRSVTARPERLTYCRTLSLRLPWCPTTLSPGKVSLLPTTEDVVISRSGNAQRLTLDGRFPIKEIWDVPSKISKYMPQLESIELSRNGGVEIIRLVEGLDLPMLKSLHIRREAGTNNDDPRQVNKWQNKLGTSPITSLSIEQYVQQPEPLTSVVRWPRALERFCFRPTTKANRRPPPDYIDFEIIHDMLLPHKETLRHVEIAWMDRSFREYNIFPARTFSNLEYLELNEDNIFARTLSYSGDDLNKDKVCCAPQAAVWALFGGSLQTLVVDGDFRRERMLKSTRIEWWERFFTEMGKLRNHQPARREVKFNNTNNGLVRHWDWVHYSEVIRERLEDLKSQAQKFGVKFSYELGIQGD
ncbi:Dolichol phosphate-mannose biosynthesis regulatory protein [Hypoxylon texense]